MSITSQVNQIHFTGFNLRSNMDENLEIIERNGGKILIYNGYQYTKHKTYVNGAERWVCANKKKYKCTGTVTIYDSKLTKFGDHNISGNLIECLPDQARNEVALTMDKIKNKAATCAEEPVSKIFSELVKPLYDQGMDILTKIPSYKSSKTAIYSKRKSVLNVKKLIYSNIDEVEIPKKFESLVLGDYITAERRIIVFCSAEGIRLLRQLEEFFIDGTFKSTPRPFSQLLTLHGDLGSTSNTTDIVPLLYALMSDKSEKSYSILYDIIKTKVPEWNPKIIHADFEMGMTNPLQDFCPNVVVKRCHYHFMNALRRKARDMNLKSKLYYRIINLCNALPLLPRDEIEEGWAYIKSQCKELDETKLKAFMNNMERNWLKSEECISEWCIHDQRHRTNNFAEGWHSKLNRQINKNYITITKLLTTLKKDMDENKMTVINFEHGVHNSKRRRVQSERDVLIINTQLQLIHKEISVGHFLEKLR